MKTINFNSENLSQIVEIIKSGALCVLPSDTLYGFSCSAFNKTCIERMYELKQRETDKPFIILIGNISDLERFSAFPTSEIKELIAQIWPAPLSAICKVDSVELKYLHRGKKSIAFRMPDNKLLLDLLKTTGPLVSTTVNISGEKPAETIEEAQRMFGEKVDLYVENGRMVGEPSTVVSFVNKIPKVIRSGKLDIHFNK